METKREKMSLNNRAKQFAPFDSLKGLQARLRLIEYQHERVDKGELDEEKVIKISNILKELNKETIIKVTYYYDGHYINIEGKAKLNIEFNSLDILNKKIDLDAIYDIDIIG